MSTQEIIPHLSHTYPFVLIDKLIQVEPSHIVAIKNVSLNEPYFQGRVHEDVEMPSSLMIEAFCQACSILFSRNAFLDSRKPSFTGLSKLDFHKPVLPGDQLRIEVEQISGRSDDVKMVSKALVDGKMVCEGILHFSFVQVPSKPQIHPTASVHPSAILGKDVVVGPYSIISEHSVIGDRTRIEAHCVISKWTTIGEDNHFFYGAVIGTEPQDHKYNGELAQVFIGNRNVIREYVTINRPTGKEAITRIGDDNMLLTGVHLGHNCTIGNNCNLTNQVNLAGHTVVADRVNIGGLVGVHQFVRIGFGAMIGGYSRLAQDVPPFMLVEGNPAMVRGLNVIGMRRNGVSAAAIKEVKHMYKVLYRSNMNTSQAVDEINRLGFSSDAARLYFDFISADSKRGLTKKCSEVEEEELVEV